MKAIIMNCIMDSRFELQQLATGWLQNYNEAVLFLFQATYCVMAAGFTPGP